MKLHIAPPSAEWPALLQRPVLETASLDGAVSEVLLQVKALGDKALFDYTERFDGVRLEALQVSEMEIETASAALPEALKQAIQTAKANIERFHSEQGEAVRVVETMPGVSCWRKSVAIDKVGLYIPGGTAPLFSTVIMLAVPARLAGCREVVLCTPPQRDGSVHSAILYTAHLVGLTRIFKVGGAQAIAAMAYGTETVPAVYKIFGPGNQYVTAAKQLVSRQGVAIDMPAGPSEVLVCADETANPAFVAADLLSQAEHGVDSQVVLVTFSVDMAKAVQAEVDKQLQSLPRKDIAQKALASSAAIVAPDRSTALEIINAYAPEHLILSVKDAGQLGELVANAGSVFLGHYTPESVGDYASGTNHTLPTNGYARMYSGVSLDSFVKKITFQRLSKAGLERIGPIVEQMAEAEELMAHKNAVSIRLRQ
ncbi:MAG: histidinol dehydrogenase [Phaeodactylibacter sp.]|nr:histidinol dehydrogenase [Phaeodactylibacter sp.]MCB9276446.1 histidinol dehydrogenase [Lewinellaceae bacterium]